MGVLDGILGLLGTALALGVFIASAARGYLRRYFFVNLVVVVLLLSDGLRYVVYHRYGLKSLEYLYTFYATDALLVTASYLLILSFFDIVFRDTEMRSLVRWTLLFFFILIGMMSYALIERSLPYYFSRLILEFQQNMYFAAVILTVLLWVSLAHLRLEDRQMGFLIAGLGLSVSATAANYALGNLLPPEWFRGFKFLLTRVPVLATIAKLSLWCYALSLAAEHVQVPQEQPALVRAEAHAHGPA